MEFMPVWRGITIWKKSAVNKAMQWVKSAQLYNSHRYFPKWICTWNNSQHREMVILLIWPGLGHDFHLPKRTNFEKTKLPKLCVFFFLFKSAGSKNRIQSCLKMKRNLKNENCYEIERGKNSIAIIYKIIYERISIGLALWNIS